MGWDCPGAWRAACDARLRPPQSAEDDRRRIGPWREGEGGIGSCRG